VSKLGYNEYFAQKEPGEKNLKKSILFIISIVLIILAVGAYFTYSSIKTGKEAYFANIKPIRSLFVDGQLSVYRFRQSQWTKTDGSFKIYQKDWFVTGAIPRTIFKFDEASNIRIAPMSEMIYLSYRDDRYLFRLNEGKAFLETFIGKYTIETNVGIVDLEKGKIQVDYSEKGNMRIYCFSGSATVSSLGPGSRETTLGPGQKIFIKQSKLLSSVSEIRKNKLDSWSKWNLSFSGKGMNFGQSPPTYRYVANRKEVQLVFKHARDRIKQFKKKREEKKRDIPAVKKHRENQPYPKVDIGTKIPRAKKTHQDALEVPKIDDNKDVPTSDKKSLIKKKLKKDRRKVQVKSINDRKDYYETLEKEEMKRKHKGAFY